MCENGTTNPWDHNGVKDSGVGTIGGAHCQACPNGGKYLGPVDNSFSFVSQDVGYAFLTNTVGLGVCEDTCPSTFPHYTTKSSPTNGDKYKICCKNSGCTGTAANDCYDGKDGSVCTAAFA